jgi:hypothetical protein
MLDIQCKKPKNSHILVSWVKCLYINPYFLDQIKNKWLYVLVRVESETRVLHKYFPVESGEATIWLKEDGHIKVLAFPFWSSSKLDKNNIPELADPCTFQFNESRQIYPDIRQALRAYESVIVIDSDLKQQLDGLSNPLDYIFHYSFEFEAARSGFAKVNKIDELISWAFKFQPIDLCQRRLFLIPALLWIPLYGLVNIPALFLLALVIVSIQIVIGVKWKYLNWELFKHDLEKPPHLDPRYRYSFSLSPLAFAFYGYLGTYIAKLNLFGVTTPPVHAFLISGIIGFIFVLLYKLNKAKQEKRRSSQSKPEGNANRYLDGKLQKPLRVLWTNLYQGGKRKACKTIIKK